MAFRVIETRFGSMKTIGIVAACAVVFVALFLYLLLGGAKPPTTGPNHHAEDSPEAACKLLAEENDFRTCRTALEKINTYYTRKPKQQTAVLDKQTQEQLQDRFKLDSGQFAEIEGDSYTPLDAHHLDQCFLLRDAARSLETEARGAGLTSLDRAARAFAWVVRQVRLQDGVFPVVPPQFALRRGWGTPLDRALVFLALLDQLTGADGRAGSSPPLRGCLVSLPKQGEKGGPELWACGVVADDQPKLLYLFDPRLGLPLPGPNGQGIATLTQARTDPTVLKQLTVQTDHPYDVSQEQAQKAELYLYCSLSALAPRMRYLQDELLAPEGNHVRLWVDALADAQKWEAVAAEEKPAKVNGFTLGVNLLRTFLSKDEGGTEGIIEVSLNEIRGFEASNERRQLPQQFVFEYELVPWNYLPPLFRNPKIFNWEIGLGQRVRGEFAEPFRRFLMTPKQARDLMLRGDYERAIPELTTERDQSERLVDQLAKLTDPKDGDLGRRVDDWLKNAQEAYAKDLKARDPKYKATPEERAEAQARVEAVWRGEGAQLIATLIDASGAQVRAPEATYYVALCKHELAEQAQLRLDMAAPKGQRPGIATAEWESAREWWDKALSYPNTPQRGQARRLYGQVLANLGQRKKAIETWEGDALPGEHPLETVACLYLAAQAKK